MVAEGVAKVISPIPNNHRRETRTGQPEASGLSPLSSSQQVVWCPSVRAGKYRCYTRGSHRARLETLGVQWAS